MSEKKFPILGTNESIDWNLIALHEKQAMENHCGQTLEQLARRHGLSWYELLCVPLNLSASNSLIVFHLLFSNN